MENNLHTTENRLPGPRLKAELDASENAADAARASPCQGWRDFRLWSCRGFLEHGASSVN